MKYKVILGAAALGMMLNAGAAFAEQAYQKDIQLFDQKEIFIADNAVTPGRVMTINDAAAELGKLQEVRYFWEERNHKRTKVLLTHAFYTEGELWMEGKVAADQAAPVVRMVTKSAADATAKGLRVGDSFTKLTELYGEPQYIHWNRLNPDDEKEVDRWLVYFCQEPYAKDAPKAERPKISKLLIGIKGKVVTRIGYSDLWRMGL